MKSIGRFSSIRNDLDALSAAVLSERHDALTQPKQQNLCGIDLFVQFAFRCPHQALKYRLFQTIVCNSDKTRFSCLERLSHFASSESAKKIASLNTKT